LKILWKGPGRQENRLFADQARPLWTYESSAACFKINENSGSDAV
jgi:hypothetical protein